MRQFLGNFELGLKFAAIAGGLVAVRAVLWELGVKGIATDAVSAGIIGAVFVLGLMIAGRLSDYKEAERAPTELAAGLYAILRQGESIHATWGKPDLTALRRRLIAVVTSLRADIDAGDTRTGQAAVEDLSESFKELDNTDVPDGYIGTLRSEQAGLRKSLLRVYHLQREEFLPSAYVLIVTLVALIVTLLMVTNYGGLAESLVAVGFLSFFFLSLIQLLNIISTPLKSGVERTDDDVSLFLLNEFVVQAQASEAGEDPSSKTSRLKQSRSKSSSSRWSNSQQRTRPSQQSARPRASRPTSNCASHVRRGAGEGHRPSPAPVRERSGLLGLDRGVAPAHLLNDGQRAGKRLRCARERALRGEILARATERRSVVATHLGSLDRPLELVLRRGRGLCELAGGSHALDRELRHLDRDLVADNGDRCWRTGDLRPAGQVQASLVRPGRDCRHGRRCERGRTNEGDHARKNPTFH